MFRKLSTKPAKVAGLAGLVLFFSFSAFGASASAAANHPPTAGTIVSSSETILPEQPVTFTATYFDSDGVEDISEAHLYIAAAPKQGSKGYSSVFYGYYSLNEDKLYLYRPVEGGKLQRNGGFSPGSANTIENDFIQLDCLQTKTRDSGDKLKILWRLTFKASCPAGDYDFYLAVKDNSGNYLPWQLKGRWNLSEPPTGPEGKEIFSSDNQVKITIPAGALDAPKIITISNLNPDSFQRLASENKPVLSIIECKPDGTTFKKQVTITSTLSQAQIPGTPVEICLYKNGKIELTGQKSSISADGYTVSFHVDHFSTYAILNGFVSQGAPIGAGVKIPLPDMLTGSFSHSIPFTIPPGRKGMQPNLTLTYRSSNPNSWVGYGFSLNPGYIVRSTRLGPPTYIDREDTFYLITDAGTTELVYLTNDPSRASDVYQARVESAFAKFYKKPDGSWEVVNKDGTKLEFGNNDDSKETSASGAFAWYITKALDTNGNYISYTYAKDKEEGKSYLSCIDYTGNENTGTSPTNSIGFSLESREDIPSSYISGSKIAIAKRLKGITVKVNTDTVWNYELEYNYCQDTGRSLLKSIKQLGSDGKSLPAQAFDYQKSH